MTFSFNTLFAQENEADKQTSKAKNIDLLMNHCYDYDMFNGTILVSENGNEIYKNALGYSNLETLEPLTPGSVFYLCSVSKQFTTMAIMILKERNMLSYSDKLSKYLPEFPSYAENVTIRNLMTHTSGIPDHYNLNAYKPGLTNKDVIDLLIQQDSLDFKPGEKYSYSNGGYVCLALIVEKVSGIPFHIFMKKNIFEPLGMEHTLVFDASKPNVSNRAIGFNATGGLDDYEILTTGAGGIFSNLEDLFKWDQSLYTEKLVSQSTLEEAFSPFILNNGEESNYGYGWGVNLSNGNKIVAHSGSLNGFRTYIRRDIKNHNSYILLTNKGASVEMGGITNALNNILNGSDFELPKIPISSILNKLLLTQEINEVIIKGNEMIASESQKYVVDEMGINNLGYQLLRENNIESALEIFNFNKKHNPSSWNAYDSMGEALLTKGDTTNAILNYKKSIEFNPNNLNGISKLSELGENIDSKNINISIETLDSYIGEYQLTPNFILTISREGEKMFIYPTGQSKSEIFPATENRFYSKIVDAQITFNKDDMGKIDSLTLYQGGETLAKKIK